jgi:hypothetical protein
MKKQNKIEQMKASNKPVALYCNISKNMKFETAVNEIFDTIIGAQKAAPNKDRVLFLDIEGYLKGTHKYQADMFELVEEFLLKMILANGWIKELSFPLGRLKNNKPQNNDLPDEINIQYEGAK